MGASDLFRWPKYWEVSIKVSNVDRGSVVYWPSTRPNMPFQSDAPEGSDTSQWPVIERRIWLTKWDKVKAHDTLIDWCAGREWLLNCMTVISARWQSNMPSQRQRKWHISDGKWWGDIEWAIELLYNTVKQEVRRVGDLTSWRSDELETRCGRESQQKAEPPGLRLSIRITRTTHGYVRRGWWGKYVAVLVRSPTPSQTQTWQ